MNLVISICNPKVTDTLTDIINKLSLPIGTVFHGRGTAVKSMLDILGIETTEKHVVLTVADCEKTKELIKLQKEQLFIGVPGHGIIVSLPIKSIGGGKTLAFLNGNKPEAKYTPELNFSYELIVAIANTGRTDLVMNAARNAGAPGGTVIHGKGTGNSAEKFYNVSIADEKEVILIVAKSSQKSDIMRAILENAGPSSPAGTICFSLPASEVAGFGMNTAE